MLDPHTLRRLRRLLASGRHADVRLAADLLAASRDGEALSVLRCALECGDKVVRSAVVQALAYHQSDAALEMLHQTVKQEQDPFMRAELVRALQAAGQIELVAGMLGQDADAEARLQTAAALGRTLPTDEQALIVALGSNSNVRVRSIRRLCCAQVAREAQKRTFSLNLKTRLHHGSDAARCPRADPERL